MRLKEGSDLGKGSTARVHVTAHEKGGVAGARKVVRLNLTSSVRCMSEFRPMFLTKTIEDHGLSNFQDDIDVIYISSKRYI